MHFEMFLIPTWVYDLLDGNGFCRSLMEVGVNIWNALLSFIYVLMGQDIGVFADGKPVEIMEKVNTVFVGVGTSLVVLFFLWGFFSDSINIREDITVDKVLKVFIRLLVSNYFVIHSLDILKILLQVGVDVNNEILSLDTGEYAKLDFSKFKFPAVGVGEKVTILFGGWMMLTVLGFVFMIVMTVCALIIVYVIYIRIIKICLYMPFGAVSFSTMSSQSPEFHNMAIGYFKNFLALVFEICVISLAILICNSVMATGFEDITDAIVKAITGTKDDFFVYYKTVIGNAFGCMLMASLTVGTVKGANEMARKIFS